MDSQYNSYGCEPRWCGLPYAQLSHLTRHILKQGMVALCGISLLCQQSMAVPMLSGNAVKQIHNSQVVAYHYDAWSRLTNRTLPNGVSTVYHYDEYGGVSNITHYQTPQQQKVITGFTYIYNQDGSIAKRSRINGLSEQAIEQYGYDDDNNLKDYQCSGALCPHDAQGKVIAYQHYTFDRFNNIKTVASNNTLTTYEYDQQIPTRLIDYHNSNPAYPSSQKLRYDRNGNILQDDRGNVITYDPLDQTRSVSMQQGTTTYFYNGIGRQIGEVIPNKPTTYFIYGQNTLLNNRVGSQQTSFLYGANRLGKQDDKGIQYYLTDQGGSVVNTINPTQEQAQNITSYAYSPYGIESDLTKQASNTAPTQHFGFDGQLTDSQTHWQFLGQGYRAYNPMLHRFMSQDSMSPFDKGGVNGYVFANNNPIVKFDPSGHFVVDVGLAMAILHYVPVIGDILDFVSAVGHNAAAGAAVSLFNTVTDFIGLGIDADIIKASASGLADITHLTEDAERIYKSHPNGVLIGLYNIDNGEVHLFPAMHKKIIISEESNNMINGYHYLGDVSLWTKLNRSNPIDDNLLSEYLSTKETIGGYDEHYLPRYLVSFADTEDEQIYNSHGLLYYWVKGDAMPPFSAELKNKTPFIGFSIVRRDGFNEFVWKSSFTGRRNGRTKEKLEALLTRAL